MPEEHAMDEEWYRLLNEGDPGIQRYYNLLRLLPSSPRCKLCAAPFRGPGGLLMRWMGREQSRYNPRYCEACKTFDHPGGAEVVISMLFADVRGSTTLAERMGPQEYSRLIGRFYAVASDVLVRADALVDKLVGDEVIGLFLRGFAGPEHPRRAIKAAQTLLERTGHLDRSGPWLPVGIGVHTGLAYVGVVGGVGENPKDFTALGDNVNITARLASLAGMGEILISDAACTASGLELGDLDRRELALKGRQEPIGVHVQRVTAG